MTQALEARLGGSPFDVLVLLVQARLNLSRLSVTNWAVLCLCSTVTKHLISQAMGRIFVGLCQVGAWGCFDEFNRLEERMLSAVSQQIQTIQEALKSQREASADGAAVSSISVELVGKQVRVSPDMAIFITMNPGYAGEIQLTR
ncbi:hypothetical protein NQ317_014465 [Molorchus minor]|uniref:Dynein heavy chain hydrolytic ATP-binding dynein motor region domain-containing protein n=1 Tax=Molorchus minor TaxID=1323400 RepID=A0ABQ9J8S3_9CUCU|nr:hypothetical protein NQ317_014465 [Molorchus minor]